MIVLSDKLLPNEQTYASKSSSKRAELTSEARVVDFCLLSPKLAAAMLFTRSKPYRAPLANVQQADSNKIKVVFMVAAVVGVEESGLSCRGEADCGLWSVPKVCCQIVGNGVLPRRSNFRLFGACGPVRALFGPRPSRYVATEVHRRHQTNCPCLWLLCFQCREYLQGTSFQTNPPLVCNKDCIAGSRTRIKTAWINVEVGIATL